MLRTVGSYFLDSKIRSRGISSFAVQLPPLHGRGGGERSEGFRLSLFIFLGAFAVVAHDSCHPANRRQPPPSLASPPDAIQGCRCVAGCGTTGGGAKLLWLRLAVGTGAGLRFLAGSSAELRVAAGHVCHRSAVLGCVFRRNDSRARTNSSRRGVGSVFWYRGRFLNRVPEMWHSLSFMIKCDGKSFANQHIAQSLFFLLRVFVPFHWNVNGSLEFQPIRAKTFF